MSQNRTFKGEQVKKHFNIGVWLIPIFLATLLTILNFYNSLLFHILAEFFAITIALLMSVVVWNTYPFTRNNFLMYLGCGYFWIAGLDMLHALSYNGMNIFPDTGGNRGTQYWIATRYFEAFLLVTAPWFLKQSLNRGKALIIFGLSAFILVVLINLDYFPDAFIQGKGLTAFKVYSEYFIITILAVAIFYLKKQQGLLDQRIINMMVASILFTMGAELAFTFYVDFIGISIIVGHVFKLFSFWLIFIAITRTTLQEPFLLMSQGATTYDAVPDATIVVDEHGVIHQANNAACILSGIDNENLVGKNNHEIFHPDNSDKESCLICQAIEGNAELRGLELQIDKAGKWFDYSLSHITGASNLDGTVEVIRDITLRKSAEDKVKELDILKNSIIENLPSMLFVKNAEDHRYIEWNKAAEDVTGMLKEDMLGNNDFDFWPKEQAQSFIDKDKEVIEKKKLFDIPEELLTTKYKGTRTIHTKKIPIFDDLGNAKYLLGISDDITDKLNTEQMLSRSQKMEAVGQMSGGIAHDFNNQLGVILGYSELLQTQALTKSQQTWVKTIQTAGERCADLTQQLLVFSRNGDVEKNTVNLNTIISEMKVITQRSLTPAINIEYYLSEDLWETEVNLGACKDVLLNLILNARDAMPDGGSLKIETTNIVLNESGVLKLANISSGEYIQIMVSDSGYGMSPEIYEHVFEPFFTTKDIGDGTGLGLSMVYGFVHKYGGDILLESKEGEGTTFRIYLPRSADTSLSKPEVSAKDIEYPKGHESVLVVDDEVFLLGYAEQILKSWGYEVFIAKNAAEAMTILEKSPIDLLFTDVVMPGHVNGYELAEKAIQLNPKLKVLITSGYAEKMGHNEKYAKYDFKLINKPYERGNLANKLRQLLD